MPTTQTDPRLAEPDRRPETLLQGCGVMAITVM